MSCGVGHRHGSNLALLWLWCRLAAAAQIIPLAWEPPYAMGAALKGQEIKDKKKKKKECHVVEIIQYVVFSSWFLSLNICI